MKISTASAGIETNGKRALRQLGRVARSLGFAFVFASPSYAAPAFFALDNGVGRGHWSPEQQAATLRELGFDGISYDYTTPVDLQRWLAATNARELKFFALYFPARLEDGEPFPAGFAEAVRLLRGSGAVLWLHLPARTRPADAFDRATKRIQQAADLAADAGLRVALYPHYECLPATAEEALALIERAGRSNVDLTFNLCHELAAGNGARVPEIIRRVAPHLAMVTVNGASDRPGALWGNYIKRLDEGDYDVAAVLRTLAEVHYAGPVGLQSYGISGDARENLAASMSAWKALSKQVWRR